MKKRRFESASFSFEQIIDHAMICGNMAGFNRSLSVFTEYKPQESVCRLLFQTAQRETDCSSC